MFEMLKFSDLISIPLIDDTYPKFYKKKVRKILAGLYVESDG